MGRAEHVRETRRQFQEAMRDQMTKIVEDTTGRRVIPS
jgi:hypothetical protein